MPNVEGYPKLAYEHRRDGDEQAHRGCAQSEVWRMEGMPLRPRDPRQRDCRADSQDRESSGHPAIRVAKPIPREALKDREADDRGRECIGDRRRGGADQQPNRRSDQRKLRVDHERVADAPKSGDENDRALPCRSDPSSRTAARITDCRPRS